MKDLPSTHTTLKSHRLFEMNPNHGASSSSRPPIHVDVSIIGGGPSGLAAALSLSRVGRPCVLFNSGVYRNAMVSKMHNVLGSDGRSNVEFRDEARRQLEAYGTVKFVDGVVVVGIKISKSSPRRAPLVSSSEPIVTGPPSRPTLSSSRPVS